MSIDSIAERALEQGRGILRRGGIAARRLSRSDPLVMLKHFGPGNPDLAL